MELIPIIKYILTLFLIFSISLVILSYSIYRIKNRSRIRPYQKKTEIKTTVKADRGSELKGKKQKERFQVLNEKYIMPVERTQFIGQPFERSHITVKREKRNEEFNIYNYYSDNSIEQMQKLRLSGMSK